MKLSDEISRLKHLRLLDLSSTKITTLPASITRLYNLQTLNLKYCKSLQELPKGICNLTNLIHLDLKGCRKLSCMPRGLGQLSNLQTLSTFIVTQENGSTITELHHLNSIQDALYIDRVDRVKDPDEAMQAKLGEKRLNSLALRWKGSDEPQGPSSTDVAVEVLERLQPHHNLKKLEINGYMGSRLPIWMSSSILPNLVRLYLWGLKRCDHLPPLGGFPLLKHLSLSGMRGMRRIGEEFYGDGGSNAFPSLENLYLSDMPNLEEWNVEPMMPTKKMATFPCLTQLAIESCPKLTVRPYLPSSVEDLEIEESNDMLLSASSLAGLSKLKHLEIRVCGLSSGQWDNENLRSLEAEERKQQQPIPSLTALRYLYICGPNKLTALPEWVGGLTLLQTLTLQNCGSLAMLPDGLRHLTALQELEIINCPLLEERCEREVGEDWDKIAHIPNIWIFCE